VNRQISQGSRLLIAGAGGRARTAGGEPGEPPFDFMGGEN